MNERIKKLYDQALESKFDYGANAGVKPGEYYSNYITVLNPEKFAELIVGECAQVSENDITDGNACCTNTAVRIARQIKQHFGVK